jgi:hypothetical protein
LAQVMARVGDELRLYAVSLHSRVPRSPRLHQRSLD